MFRVALYCLITLLALIGGGCRDSKVVDVTVQPPDTFLASLDRNDSGDLASAIVSKKTITRIERFCGDCHALPNPESFEKEVWYKEVRKGFEFYARSGRVDLDPPTIEDVVRYYRSQASEKMVFPVFGEVDHDWSNKFRTDKLDWADQVEEYILPCIGSLNWAKWSDDGSSRLLVCDARDGSVSVVNPNPKQTNRHLLTRLQNPARVHLCDIDGNGLKDLVIADLGSMYPYEHRFGRVACLRRVPNSSILQPILVAQNLGRIADVAVGNLVGDSQPDVVVAEFGHQEMGGLHLLQNVSQNFDELKFESIRLDIRPGTVRVLLNDWNGDGLLDITTLVTQETESVDIYLNRGDRFERNCIWQALDVTYGSVAMEPADLDQDGDMDLIICNGDTFDNNLANKSHGVQWLENLGEMKFHFHRLVDLPGAYSAKAGDIDNDGDLDIIAVANLPEGVIPASLGSSRPPSIVLLEQTEAGYFAARILSRDAPRYATVEMGDFNADGKMDFAVGAMLLSAAQEIPRVTIFWQK